ncbi:MAG: YdcF family protein [Candidatus Methylomirabilaceae bacterium]
MLGRLIRWLIIFPILGLLLYLGYPYLLRTIGHYLVTEDPLKHADAIVVLAGDGGVARTLEAVRLYQDGYAPKIILTHQVLPKGYEALARLGISVPEERDIQWMVLKGMRVPRAAVLQIQERANSTDAEMSVLARFMDQQRIRSIILVTSKSHSTRARKILRRASGAGITIISRPTRYDTFDPHAWWQSRRDAKEVLGEYAKLVNYWVQAAGSSLTGWTKERERDPAKVVATTAVMV